MEAAGRFFSKAENRGSLALVLCVCSCAEEKLQQQVFIQHKKS